MERDRLLLLKPGFLDPAFPGQTFYCWHCALIEGVLTSFPQLAERIQVERIDWPRPRAEILDVTGNGSRPVPLLVLAQGEGSSHQTGKHQGRAFVSDKDAILAVLTERHGFPHPHP